MAFNDADKEMAKRTLRQYCSSWEEIRYDEMHNKPYFIGKRDKNSKTETLFPISCYKALTFDELKSCIEDSGSTSVNLAVYNSDSTVVLYKAESGLKPPIFLTGNKCSISDNSSVALHDPTSTKKRKIDTVSDNLRSDQSETGSTTDSFQIDLNLCPDSELSESDQDTEDSNTCSEDKLDIICS